MYDRKKEDLENAERIGYQAGLKSEALSKFMQYTGKAVKDDLKTAFLRGYVRGQRHAAEN
jgi:ribosome modulation factor